MRTQKVLKKLMVSNEEESQSGHVRRKGKNNSRKVIKYIFNEKEEFCMYPL